MRVTISAVLAALFMMLATSGPSSAEGLKGEQIKKLLIGNTLHAKYIGDAGREFLTWIYYKDEGTRVSKRIIRTPRGDRYRDVTAGWTVSEDGTICHVSRRGTRCRTNVRVSGDTVKMDGVDGARDMTYKLLKGEQAY